MNSISLTNDLRSEYARLITRRWFFRQCGVGLGSIALASLLQDDKALGATSPTGSNPLAPKSPHFKPKAKRVIYLFMGGAPSQLDLFDYKPTLAGPASVPGPSMDWAAKLRIFPDSWCSIPQVASAAARLSTAAAFCPPSIKACLSA